MKEERCIVKVAPLSTFTSGNAAPLGGVRWRCVLASERNAEATDSRRAGGRSGRDTAEQTPISSYCIAAVAKTMAVSHE